MIIELPKEVLITDKKKRKVAFIENDILKISRKVSFDKIMIKITYQMKGRGRCYYCGRNVPRNQISIDHVYPKDFGGPTIPDNLLPACQKCNLEKDNMTYEQYMQFLEEKNKGLEKQYLKELRENQEKIRRNDAYEIPEEWISQKEITNIITNIDLKENYKNKKYRSIENYYLKYGKVHRPIVLDRRSFLLDGFMVLMLAKKYNISVIPAIEIENVEVII